MLYVDVIVKQRSKVEELTYAVPASMVPYIRSGSLVSIPLRRRIVDGIVVALRRTVARELKDKIKPVSAIERDKHLNAASIAVMRQLAQYYGASLGEVGFHALDQPYTREEFVGTAAPIQPTFIQAPIAERFETYLRLVDKLTEASFVCVFAQKSYLDSFCLFMQKKGREVLIADDTVRFRKAIESKLAAGERFVIAATGAGAFLPLVAGDALIVDQPSHFGLKQQQRPYMRMKTTARVRAQLEGLRLFYGDDLPEVVDIVRFQKKEWGLKVSRGVRTPLTVMSRLGSSGVLMPNVLTQLRAATEQGGRCLVVSLARGWASAYVCQECGHLFQCPKCARTLAVDRGVLVCRYDDTTLPLGRVCPKCRATKLREVGEGVARVRSEIEQLLPGVQLHELSSDQPTLPSGGVIVATEKILSFPLEQFDLVVLASVDRLLAGVALDDRWELVRLIRTLGVVTNTVTVQTHQPDDPIWSTATSDLRSFYAAELGERRKWKMPPYGQLIGVIASGADEATLRQSSKVVRQLIGQVIPDGVVGSLNITPLGPKRFRATISISVRSFPASDRRKLAALLPHAWHLDVEPSG